MGKKKTNVKSSPRPRTFFQYNNEQLINALKAIKNGMKVQTASKKFNIPRTTLRRKILEKGSPVTGKIGPECLLGNEIESVLVEWVKINCQMGFPVQRECLCFSVKKILDETKTTTPFKNNLPGRKWFEKFMQRHQELALKQAEYINKARASITPEKIKGWFEETEKYLGNSLEVLNDPSRVWNLDETAFYLNPKGGLVIAEKGKHVYYTSNNSDKENITTLLAVNAIGDFAPPLTIYKCERMPSSYAQSAPNYWGIGKSKTGWMTAEIFYDYFKNVFYNFLCQKNYKFPVVVFLDGHTSHTSLALSNFCKERQIILVCLYPNATHILQPLDVTLFFPLKCQWKKAVKKWRLEHEGSDIRKHQIPTLLHDIITGNSFKGTIINGFRVCGLYPFTSENVDYSKCTKKIDTDEVLFNEENDRYRQTVNENDHLNYLESKIDPKQLEEFKCCLKMGNLPPDIETKMLYDIWCKFKVAAEGDSFMDLNCNDIDQTDAGYIEFPFPEFDDILNDANVNLSSTSSAEVEMEDKINCDLLMPNIENVDSLTPSGCDLNDKDATEYCCTDLCQEETNSNKTDFESKLNETDINEETLIENDETDVITESEDVNTTMVVVDKNNEQAEKKMEKGPTEIPKKVAIKILSNILINSTKTKTIPRKNRNKERMPSVLTSDEWMAIAQKKEKEKEELKRKEERKKKREEKRKMLEQKTTNKRKRPEILNNNKQIKKKKSEEKNNNKENLNNSDKQDQKELEQEVEETKVIEKEQEEAKEQEPIQQSDIKVGIYVVIQYITSFFPGQVTEITSEGISVSAMERSGINDWKWPDKKDELVYMFEEIKEIIKEPKKKNTRGAYIVPEMAKYVEVQYL